MGAGVYGIMSMMKERRERGVFILWFQDQSTVIVCLSQGYNISRVIALSWSANRVVSRVLWRKCCELYYIVQYIANIPLLLVVTWCWPAGNTSLVNKPIVCVSAAAQPGLNVCVQITPSWILASWICRASRQPAAIQTDHWCMYVCIGRDLIPKQLLCMHGHLILWERESSHAYVFLGSL